MCGIVGFISDHPCIDGNRLRQLRDAISHRGPDWAGLCMWNGSNELNDFSIDGTAGLGHRRLSILDLSDSGSQPMASEDRNWWISYNGEFYNYLDFRDDLINKGHVFKSHSDTEVLLKLVALYGVEWTLERLNGMFAFALFDLKHQRVILARDRLGKKPLYYYQRADGSLFFASEIKALLNTGWIDRANIDLVALAQIWTYGYTHGNRTVYKQIRQIPAAHYAIWKNGTFTLNAYWDCSLANPMEGSWNQEKTIDQFEELLSDAIRIRLNSDVPLGVFLSGGVDSSVIAALAARITGTSINSYTIAFKSSDFDESPYAQEVASHIGIPSHVLNVDESLSAYFSKIVGIFDEPFGDPSCIPTWFLAQEARKYVTVALTGDGGDELFGGYPWYQEALRLWGHAKSKSRNSLTLASFMWEMKLRFLGVHRGLSELESITSARMRRRIFSPRIWDLIREQRDEVNEERLVYLRRASRSSLLTQMQYLDLHTYLTDDILVKVDRMSMAHGLECRSPFLDYRVVEYAFSLPDHQKIGPDGKGKWLLRTLLSRYLPNTSVNRPKRGFTPPWQEWCRSTLVGQLRNTWRHLPSCFRPEASDWITSLEATRHPYVLWNAFSTCCTLGQWESS